jgi:dTDP-4-dehydrorhamnose reductase
MNASAIVFGADGQIGREIVSLAEIRGLDIRGLTHAEADITNAASVKNAFEKFKPALAINCAAYTAVDRAEHETEFANTVNIDGAETVATVCASMNVPLIHLSTDYVFDGNKKGAYMESDAPAPVNAYGRSKLAGEKRIQAALKDYVILRTSWVYGFYGNNFLKTILRLAQERDELRVVSDQHGCPTAAADIAEALLVVGEKLSAQEPVAGIYHFAGTGRASWYEFANEIAKRQSAFTNRSPKVIPVSTAGYPTPAKRPMNSELSSALFIRTFGYTAKPWRERTAETVDALFAAGSSKATS